ncbi:MAG: sugar nucleotide-binding protein [Defluviitaleaceae bacterium]|nr:sugar nucleotide-binding protein [Defluviitaleaceae bacterium]
MKILIFGASGLVGGAICKELAGAKEYEVHGTFNKNKPEDFCEAHKYDIADEPRLDGLLARIKPDLIISSLTGDFTQQLGAHKTMAEYLKKNGGRMIFISTANVFDGAVSGNHSEAAVPYPLSRYGKFKQSCEEMLRHESGANCLIVRLPKIISGGDSEDITGHIKKGNGFYSNLYFNFNTPENVARAVKHCIEKSKSGVVHLVSGECMSDAEWAGRTLAQAGLTMEYETSELSEESYCALLGCSDISKLAPSKNGGFYLTIICTDKDVAQCCQ